MSSGFAQQSPQALTRQIRLMGARIAADERTKFPLASRSLAQGEQSVTLLQVRRSNFITSWKLFNTLVIFLNRVPVIFLSVIGISDIEMRIGPACNPDKRNYRVFVDRGQEVVVELERHPSAWVQQRRLMRLRLPASPEQHWAREVR